MLIIGERINSTRRSVQALITSHDAPAILKAAKEQLDAGADLIDINCAMGSGDELADMDWVMNVIQGGFRDASICIDSPNHLAIDKALTAYKGKGRIMLNSISGEEERIRHILPLAVKRKAKLVALTMNDKGMPETAEERLMIAKDILARAVKEGMDPEDLYFDPLIRPIATEPKQASEFLKSIPMIKGLGGVKTVCGLSNVSFGLPDRSLINAAFLAMAIHAGLDAAIMDPLDRNVISVLRASEALLGTDEYCAGYIKAFRDGRLI
ncbi:MAG: dihydropteroate synthase [Candidatus Omnitrophota bacterium]